MNRGAASSSVSEDENSLQVSQTSSSSYLPIPVKKQQIALVEPVNLGMNMFVCLTSQVAAFIEQLNQNMQCRTIGCNGMYVPIRAVTDGLGGAMKIIIACNGCKMRSLTFGSSPLVESSRRSIVGLALQVAFYTSGCTHIQYYRTLRQFLGVSAVTCKPFYEMIKLVYPHVNKKGPQYHWLLDLFHRLKIPFFDGMKEALTKANESRTKKLECLKTEKSKKLRIALKQKREVEQEVRKQWLKEQGVNHGYGEELLDLETEGDDETATNLLSETTFLGIEGGSIVASRRYWKCGSTDHLRTSSSHCPLNSQNQSSSSSTFDIAVPRKRKCGPDTHSRISHRDCPPNRNNQI